MLALGTAVLGLVALGSMASLPEAWAAGPRLVLSGLLAVAGTGASALLPLVALAVGHGLSRSLSSRGEAAACESLGASAVQVFASLSPLWFGMVLLSLSVSFGVEPAAWSTIHQVRGSPAAAAAAWSRLESGEARVLGDGGVLHRDEALGLRLSTGDRGWVAELAAPSPRPAAAAWDFGSLILEDRKRGGRWEAEQLRLRMRPEPAARWLAPPSSPASLGLSDLALRRQSEPRAALVWHRRLALAAAVPLLALVGWLLGWESGGARARGRELRTALAVGSGVLLFVLARLADGLVLDGRLGGALAGWLPLVAALCLALLALGRRGR